ncbi:unnamed protein product [Urochloa decumbens]|uniref:Fe2OG dioxygenase domain-containing protein n=1 Tax=Urochloa decumbens TaxID=240449 RepID=A0ABC9GAT2_9POAL
MENLLSSSASHDMLPDSFVFPPDQRPPASTTAAVALPVIDLSLPRDEVRRAVLDAGKDLGFFQVTYNTHYFSISSSVFNLFALAWLGWPTLTTNAFVAQVVNHGVPEQAMRDMESSCSEFFRLPASDKSAFYTEDTDKPNRLFSSTVYGAGGERYWRDCLRLAVPFPLDPAARDAWPDKPAGLRPAVQAFVPAARALGMELLRLLCEGAGLRHDYFEGDLAGGDVVVNVNHYPPCPEPERTLGLPPHCDRNLITLLLPGSVPGLEVACRDGWIRVPHVPGAFVVNFGHQLEIATNGLLKSVEHRAAANAGVARTSVATFIMPTEDCLVAPAAELVGGEGGGNPARYRAVTFREFMRVYKTVGARREAVEKAFKI